MSNTAPEQALAAPGESILPAHALHAPTRAWPLTNCSLDLWITLLHSRSLAPEPLMGALLQINDEGDHFTFCKFDMAELERMHGLVLYELAVFDHLQTHAQVQTARGHTVLVELDGFHLPDTRSTSYQRTHSKTTVGIVDIAPERRWLRYLHNAGCYELSGDDYSALFAVDSPTQQAAGALFPYAEFVQARHAPLSGAALRQAALESLRLHLALAPRLNPFTSYLQRFDADMQALIERGDAFFHLYAFNHFRQFGAVFAFLGSYAEWLGAPADSPLVHSCNQIAEQAKLLQLRVARVVARKRPDNSKEIVAGFVGHWETVIAGFSQLAS